MRNHAFTTYYIAREIKRRKKFVTRGLFTSEETLISILIYFEAVVFSLTHRVELPKKKKKALQIRGISIFSAHHFTTIGTQYTYLFVISDVIQGIA